MTKFSKGQDVIVIYMGVEHPGVVLSQSRSDVLCRIAIDPEMDYGDVSSTLALHSLVSVNEKDVKTSA
jgi:hypothetical protein